MSWHDPTADPWPFVDDELVAAADLNPLLDNLQFLGSKPSVGVHVTPPTISDSTLTVIDWDNEDWKTVTSMHTNGSHPERLVVPYDALYEVFADVVFEAAASGVRRVDLVLNGTTTLATAAVPSCGASDDTPVHLRFAGAFSAADYLTVLAYQTSGGDVALSAAPASTAELTWANWL
jgi:hypothetical protein